MYTLPKNTLLKKQIAKTVIFDKFPSLTTAQRQRIDADISRIDIIACLSQSTLPAIAKGQSVKEIFVMAISLKTNNYHKDSITLLSRLIPQHILFVLSFEEKARLAIVHEGFHEGNWNSRDDICIPIEGLDFDRVWEHLVTKVGDITIQQERTLTEQISVNKEREKLQEQIAVLERKIDKEKSLGKQMQLRSEINQLKKILETDKKIK